MSEPLDSRLQLALLAAREAGDITLRYFQQTGLAVERKSDASPVTIADRQAEEHLRKRISERFPDDGILGEELPDRPGTSGYRWILDPIDGTKSFIAGVPLYGTLIGLEHQGRSVLGIIRMPALDEQVYASIGQGAWHQVGSGQPKPARVSKTTRLADAMFCTSEVKSYFDIGRGQAFLDMQQAVWIARTWGDCYGYLLVATGRVDIMIDPQMAVWDAAALLPIIEEAGGTFTDWNGVPTIHGGEGVATNGLLSAEVLARLRR